MSDSFQSLIKDLKSILILLPKDPYFDQVASGLALYLSLSSSGKDVLIYCPSPMLVEFNRLVGADKVVNELGKKNLVISLADYDAEASLEGVTYDIEGTRMNIIVIPKANIAPPSKDQVVISYSGVNAELAILIGGAHERHFPALASEDMQSVKLAHIGIQELLLPEGRRVISFARPASSISEVTFELINGFTNLTSDIATNLLMGMYEGSRNFSSQDVTHETFKMASQLMQAGGKHISQDQLQKSNFQRKTMPGGFSLSGMPMPMEKPDHEKPDIESTGSGSNPPASWMKAPKIYKGTSIS